MKKYLFISLLFFLIASCNKDIPKDIPDWLKDEIKHCKKKGNCCYTGLQGLQIYEYKNTSNNKTYFVFKRYDSMSCMEFFDYDGNLVCNYNHATCNIEFCDNVETKYFIKVRDVWSKSSSQCK